MHTAEPSVSGPSASDAEVAIGKLERYKPPSVDQIPEELIQAGGGTLRSEIHKFIELIWNKEFPYQWKESIVIPIHKKVIKLSVVIIQACHCCQIHTKLCQTFFSLG
jgi:hypothetical protein